MDMESVRMSMGLNHSMILWFVVLIPAVFGGVAALMRSPRTCLRVMEIGILLFILTGILAVRWVYRGEVLFSASRWLFMDALSAFHLVVMMLVFGLSFFSYGLVLITFLLILFLFGIALGIFACALVLRLGPSAEWFVWPVPALLSPFAGVFYPLSTLPQWMQIISHMLPPAYVFESVRAIVSGRAFPEIYLIAGIGLDVLYILLAYLFFSRTYRYAVRTGLIARYSAESVS
jgi:hypothetical protein